MDRQRKSSVGEEYSFSLIARLTLAEMGTFLHATEGEMVCESINTKIPYFNAPIYLENKVGGLHSMPRMLADIYRPR